MVASGVCAPAALENDEGGLETVRVGSPGYWLEDARGAGIRDGVVQRSVITDRRPDVEVGENGLGSPPGVRLMTLTDRPLDPGVGIKLGVLGRVRGVNGP